MVPRTMIREKTVYCRKLKKKGYTKDKDKIEGNVLGKSKRQE
jgi:hypothetical protein